MPKWEKFKLLWRLSLCFFILSRTTCFALETESLSIVNFVLGDSVFTINQVGETQLALKDGTELTTLTNGFRLKYEDGTEVRAVKFQSNTRAHYYNVTYEDGSNAVYYIKACKGYVWFKLIDLKTSNDVEQCQLCCISVPNSKVLPWINTVTLKNSVKVGVMTTSCNVLPTSDKLNGVNSNKEGGSHSFTLVTKWANNYKFVNNSPIAEFSAKSTLEEPDGWVVSGKNYDSSLNLNGVKKLRARIYGDGKKEALKIQLVGAIGYRDDYITIDLEG